MKILTKIFLFFLSATFFLYFTQFVFADTKTFTDNFDTYTEGTEGLKVNWERIDDQSASCNLEWQVKNGKIGMVIINHTSCSTNLVPKESVWNNLGDNYIFDIDIEFVTGTDHNLAFRFSPNSPTNDWYEVHFQTPNDFSLDRVSSGHYDTFIAGQYRNGNTYHLTIEVKLNNIKVYINGLLVRDYTSNIDRFPKGKIALRAGVGGDPNSETWFDNLVVRSLEETTPTETPTPEPPTPTPTPIPPTPTPTPPTPIVFLPGLGASFNFKEMFSGTSDSSGWQMTPGAKVYNNLLKAFEGNPNFYVFYYDWRKPVLESAQKLNDFVKNSIKPWNNKVNLVGHSLGGLVERTCIQKTENNCYVDKLITIGSPHSGAVQVYPVVEAGEIWGNNIVDTGLELLIHYYQKPGETRRETATRIAPVAFDLLPIFDYLKKDGVPLPWAGLSAQNPLLPYLQDFSSLKNHTTTFYGKTFPTYDNISVSNPSPLDKILGNWADGNPAEKYYEDGDATVLAKSAVIEANGIEKVSFDFDHSRLISDPMTLQKIFEILNIPFPQTNFFPTSDEKDYLIFFAHSPVELSSPDINENSFVNPEMIIIPRPQNKIYTLNIKGLSDKYYSLSIGRFFSGKVFWNDYSGKAKTDQTQQLQFNINNQNLTEDILIDNDGSITSNNLKSLIDEFKDEILALDIKFSQKKILIDLLNKIQNQTGKPEKALNSLYILRQSIVIYENKKQINSETANTFRKKASQISQTLEFLAFSSPDNTKKAKAVISLSSTENIKKSIKTEILVKNGALVFLEAQEKLDKAYSSFKKGEYYKVKIYSEEAGQLFLEAKLIKLTPKITF